MFDTVIRGAVILSGHNGYKPFPGSVGIQEGRIAAVDGRAGSLSGSEVIDASGRILMPGLVNGHCHGDMTLARGLGDGMTLQEQNVAFADVNWFYSLITDEDRFYSRQLTYAEALLSGTTFLLENMYWSLGEDSAKAMADTGIAGALAEDIRVDFRRPDEFLSADALRKLGDGCSRYGLLPVIGGVSEEDFDARRLKNIYKIVTDLGCRQTCHLAETSWRAQRIRDTFGTTPVRFLDDCGVLAGLIGSHAVQVSREEAEIMGSRGASVVNTPLCEMKIADGVAPIPEYLAAGVTVGLGTDGAMWNNSNDLFREMKCVVLLHALHGGVRSVSAADALDMATRNGAKVFGLEDEIGSVEAGKRADLILIDATGAHMTPLRTGRHENVASSVVFNATGRDVTDVFVKGRRVVADRRLTTVDLRTIQDKVTSASVRIAEQLK